MPPTVLHVVTNVAHYDDPGRPTGLWLTELTHAWEVFERAGVEQRIASPAGGPVPLEPRSLGPGNLDRGGRTWLADPARMALLQDTVGVRDVDPGSLSAVYLTGGHGVMYDFRGSTALQDLVRGVHTSGGVVSSVCHGYCGLLDVTLDDGAHLIADRRMTGFAWAEERLARVDRHVPYNAEQVARARDARYVKGRLPFAPHVVVDGRLVTGQNPASARRTAQAVAGLL
ncbi:type 1 glutamine amidotransferase domain-containing protein [Nocardioides bruguierae]|uniref:Type 1 glutamine amidotransferase domain-containing protein n=1 Tax=Nocardioides bruguierae TaxID=2945102 RepID=A0A9X2D4M1_9ACTN|nr:type 1 glutamine amidotransferase domain-containing protein [Nocardioides bruguierae]MCL8026000.1 type 1 glutamine amidotransferase domain-containing protein [Nocardioides bruguierae]MCM0619128.1 type 1 glutamine amidotransferase domain-containing protein [Nocardioides bruguierae]